MSTKLKDLQNILKIFRPYEDQEGENMGKGIDQEKEVLQDKTRSKTSQFKGMKGTTNKINTFNLLNSHKARL